jgi:uncharacterized repeat protein (TIGR01451 family)
VADERVRLAVAAGARRPRLGTIAVVVLVLGFGLGSGLVVAPAAQAARTLSVSVTDGLRVAGPGDLLRYRVTVSAPAGTRAAGVAAWQRLGQNLSFVSATGGGRWDAGQRVVRWPRFDLDAGQARVLTVMARVDRAGPLAEPVSTEVSASAGGQAVAAADETQVVPDFDVMTTDGRDVARPGDELRYTVTVSNANGSGPGPVSVVDTLDAGLAVVSAAGGGVVDPSGRRVCWAALAIPPGGSATLTFVARLAPDARPGVVSSTVVATAAAGSYRAVDNTTVRSAAALTPGTRQADSVPPGMVTLLNENEGGSWCWFEDERAIIDRAGRRLYTSVTTGVDMFGTTRLLELDLDTGARRIVDLGRAEVDDHATAAIWEAPNGEVLTSWSRHGDQLQRQHRRLGDGTWVAQPPLVVPEGFATYNNLYSVDHGALLYNFYRSGLNDPYAETSSDGGRTWTYRGRLLRDPEDSADRWPYVKYTSNGVDRIDFIATPSHPRQTATEIYHGFIRDGVVYRSDGTELGPVGSSIDVTRLTLVWAPPDESQDGWDVDLGLDPATGGPVAMFVRNVNFDDNRYYYARWDGAAWDVKEIAFAGRSFYNPERHYTGLAAIDPNDPNDVVISTDADPGTGAPLASAADGQRHRELFRGTRQSDGAFSWAPMTMNSTVDNIRPVWTTSPSGASALLWLRGRYTTFLNYSMAVVGLLKRADGSSVVPGALTPPADSGDADVRSGNFDRHATSDLLMYRSGAGPEELRLFDNRGNVSRVPLPPAPDGRQAITGDFNGDGLTDVYWYAPGDVVDLLWTQNDSAFVTSVPAQVRGNYQPLVGDYDGDGDDDIFWYAPGPAPESIWLAEGGRFRATPARQVGGAYRPFVGNFDGVNGDDIFWYAPGPAGDSTWYFSGAAVKLNVARAVGGSYQPTVGNYDGARGDDIYWYNPTGPDPLWSSTGSRVFTDSRSRDMGPPPAGGQRALAGNFDGIGGDDLIWFAPGGPDLRWESHQSVFDVTAPVIL